MSLTNYQYNQIMQHYEQEQLVNRSKLLKRYDRLYEQIPELKEIDHAVSSISLAKARTLLEGDESSLSSLKEQLHQLTRKRAELLTSHNYPADYLETIYTCEDCQDTGYHNGQKCHCFQKAVIDLLYNQSNLPKMLQHENFETFSLEYYSHNFIDELTKQSSYEVIQQGLKDCHRFIDEFATTFQNLLLYGHTGVGKTFLANCVAKELIDRSYSVMYFPAPDLFEKCAQNTFHQNPDYQNIEEQVTECDLLVIDDLGTERINSFTNSQLFTFLNSRILKRKSTIISTNLSLNDIKSLYSERTFSRVSSHYTMIRLIGDDIRIQKKLMDREEQ